MAKPLIAIGLLITVAGIILYFFPTAFRFIGHLPGDFNFEKGNFKMSFPLATCLLISLILTIIIRFISKWSFPIFYLFSLEVVQGDAFVTLFQKFWSPVEVFHSLRYWSIFLPVYWLVCLWLGLKPISSINLNIDFYF